MQKAPGVAWGAGGGCLWGSVLTLGTSLLEAILFKRVRHVPRGEETNACL